MSASLVIKGATILDAQGQRSGDVAIHDGLIVEVGPDLSGRHVLDASGCILTPGLVDLAARTGEPGAEDAETIESASRAAALGGFTAVVALGDTAPLVDSAAVVRDIQSMSTHALCDVAVSGCLTVGRSGSQLAPIAEMVELGVSLFGDAGHGVQDPELMRRAMEYASVLEVTLTQHCDTDALSRNASMNESELSARLGLVGQPNEAVDLMVMRDIALARLTGGSVHFTALSTKGSIPMVAAARSAGLSVSGDVCFQHLVGTEADCATYDTLRRFDPPLRTSDDRDALVDGVATGTIGAIATHHTPCVQHDKELPFDSAAVGAIGLEQALALVHDRLGEAGLGNEALFAALSWSPAQLARLTQSQTQPQGQPVATGSVANLCVFDPAEQWTLPPNGGASRSANDPHAGTTVRGRVRHTVYRGEPVVIDAQAQR